MTPGPQRRPRAVLFDAAGTLIRLREPVGETYRRFAREQGVELPAWRIEDAFRRVLAGADPMVFPDETPAGTVAAERRWWRERVRATFRAADQTLRFRDFDACFEALWSHYAGAGAWELAPGARALLERLRAAGLATAVVSNFDHRLHGILEGLGVDALFDVVVLPGDCGAAKPDVAAFRFALARLGVAPEEALYVGDDPRSDLPGAEAAGMRAVDVGELATLGELWGRLAPGPGG